MRKINEIMSDNSTDFQLVAEANGVLQVKSPSGKLWYVTIKQFKQRLDSKEYEATGDFTFKMNLKTSEQVFKG